MSGPATIVSVTPIAIERDSRTLKQATSLARLGYRSVVVEGERSAFDSSDLSFELVTVAGAPPPPTDTGGPEPIARNGHAPIPPVQSEVSTPRRPWGHLWPGLVSTYWRSRWALNDWRFRVRASFDWNRRTYRALPAADLYVLHSYAQFPAVFMASIRHSGRIAYDAHDSYFEIEPETGGAWDRAMAAIERLCVRFAAGFTTVSGGVADILEERHRRRPLVLRNCHDLRLDRPAGMGGLRDVLGLTGREFVLVSVGNYKPGMGAKEAMRALADLPARVHLAFVGRGFAPVRDQARELELQERVHFPGAVPPAQVAQFIASADVGLVLYRPLTRNYLYALPNGFFQAIAAGLPLLYPRDLPEVRAIAERHEIGLPVDPTDPTSIADGVRELIDDPDRRKALRKNAGAARDAESWEREEQTLDTYVASILSDGRRRLLAPARRSPTRR
jgi:glycosyltransferase involved in cell wall biosynthesis